MLTYNGYSTMYGHSLFQPPLQNCDQAIETAIAYWAGIFPPSENDPSYYERMFKTGLSFANNPGTVVEEELGMYTGELNPVFDPVPYGWWGHSYGMWRWKQSRLYNNTGWIDLAMGDFTGQSNDKNSENYLVEFFYTGDTVLA